MPELTTTVRREDGRSTVTIVGTVTRDAAEPMRSAWDEAARDAERVTLDFSGMDYLNSSGIAVLVGLLADARVNGVAVAAHGLSDHFRHVFEITRISDLIDLGGPR